MERTIESELCAVQVICLPVYHTPLAVLSVLCVTTDTLKKKKEMKQEVLGYVIV